MNKRETGAGREALAAEYLAAHGMHISERNFHCRQGEIDIIGYHNGYLVFVEVKYRGTENFGGALEAVDLRKQRRICRTADHYRYLHRLGDDCSVRYDVVAFQGTEISWIQNAFPHIYSRR
ncbi:MAG: YraN family protein [Eubacterium sp.]|nr:YraN family protein [Eubacterium sp.]MCM1216616.1 YraN family protein [Lachnospiraceae bacterium]MCM1303021.1 YraN family protein [Butyrivibrio sp.]MCM1345232.1 YraN family protein [Muribaculaceae bacterium]MCM1239715.1 YraN family protein [Lachnospiraceae bacterium]